MCKMAKTTLNLDVLENLDRIERTLNWPDLSEVFPTNSEELHQQLLEASEYNLDDLTGGAGIQFLIDRGNIPERPLDESNEPFECLSPDEVKSRIDDQESELQEDTSELFFRISTLSTQAGLLSKLPCVERLLIQSIIERALRFGRRYGGAQAIGYNSEALSSIDDAKNHGGAKGVKTREAAFIFLKEQLKENGDYSIRRLAAILEADSKNNPKKYGKIIPEGSCVTYARQAKKNREQE
jgi:hypothetical protein